MALITSIQPFEITIAAASVTNTATISAVDTSRAGIIDSGSVYDNGSSTIANAIATLQMADSTTVIAARSGTTGGLTRRGYVVEWADASVDSVQQGIVSLNGAITQLANVAVISPVTTADTPVFHLGHNAIAGTSSVWRYYSSTIEVTSTINVTATRANTLSSTSVNVGFVAVEFAPGILASYEVRAPAFTTNLTTDNDTVSSVTATQTMLAFGGTRSDNSIEDAFQYSLELTSGTNVALTRNSTSTTSRTACYGVVQFQASDIAGIDRGSVTISGATLTNNVTIGAVDANYTFANHLGASGSGDTMSEQQASIFLTSTTNLRATKGAGGSADDTTIGYEVIEFTSSSGTSITSDSICGFEYKAGYKAEFPAQLEISRSIRGMGIVNYEYKSSYQRSISVPDEFLSLQRSDYGVADEVLSGVQSDNRLQLETTGGLELTLDTQLPFELIGIQTVDTNLPLDAMAGVKFAGAAELESLGRAQSGNSLPVEITGSQKTDGIVPLELTVNTKSDAGIPDEFISSQRSSCILPDEIISALRSGDSLPFENLVQVRGSSNAQAEIQSAQQRDGNLQLESMGGIAVDMDATAQLEFSGNVSTDATAPYETVASLAQRTLAHAESQAGQKYGGRAYLEVTGALEVITSGNAQLEFLGSIKSDTPLFYESVAGLIRQALAHTESMVSAQLASGIPLEIGGNVEAVIANAALLFEILQGHPPSLPPVDLTGSNIPLIQLMGSDILTVQLRGIRDAIRLSATVKE